MQLGVVFPQNEIEPDRTALRAYTTGVTELGFDHILCYDHVVGADPAVHENWSGPYDVDDTFHEPFVLYGYLSAITPLEVVTGIVIAPQRQTALLAKQAAEVDLLTDGRFRLGVGIGWNAVEYEALDKSFTNRGARLTEQVALLRALWTERSVTFEGRYERVVGAGIAPLPIQRPIPIWFGGQSTPAYERAGALGDGWFPQVEPGPGLDAAIEIVHGAARRAGRDPGAMGMEGRVSIAGVGAAVVVERVEAWRVAGASHVSINTTRGGLGGVDAHLAALADVARALGR